MSLSKARILLSRVPEQKTSPPAVTIAPYNVCGLDSSPSVQTTNRRSPLVAINHAQTITALAAERAFLAELDGSCRTPIAGHAEVANGALSFHGMILKPDGSEAHETRRRGDAREAQALGADAGRELKRRAPADFFVH